MSNAVWNNAGAPKLAILRNRRGRPALFFDWGHEPYFVNTITILREHPCRHIVPAEVRHITNCRAFTYLCTIAEDRVPEGMLSLARSYGLPVLGLDDLERNFEFTAYVPNKDGTDWLLLNLQVSHMDLETCDQHGRVTGVYIYKPAENLLLRQSVQAAAA